MGENRNRRNKRRSRNSLGNRMALIGITVVVGSLAVVVHIGGTSLRERDLEYQAREQALEKTLAKEEARAAELEEYRVYVQTKLYHVTAFYPKQKYLQCIHPLRLKIHESFYHLHTRILLPVAAFLSLVHNYLSSIVLK